MFAVNDANDFVVRDDGDRQFRQARLIIDDVVFDECGVSDTNGLSSAGNFSNNPFSNGDFYWANDRVVSRTFCSECRFLNQQVSNVIFDIDDAVLPPQFADCLFCDGPKKLFGVLNSDDVVGE